MNYLIFACIGLGIIILILLFMALDRIENSLDYIKGSINNIATIIIDIIFILFFPQFLFQSAF